MKIVLVGPVYPYRGGIAHFTTQLFKKLLEKKHDISVISFRKLFPKFLYPGKTDQDQSKVFNEIPACFLLNPLNPITWIKTAKIIKNLSPDLILFQWWTPFLAPVTWFLGKYFSRRKIPLIFIIHNVLPHESNPLDRYLTKMALSCAGGFIVQSFSQVDLIKGMTKSKNIFYSSLPIFDQFDDQEINRVSARESLSLKNHDFVLLFFGIVRPYKGLKYLLRAVAILIEQGIPIKLIVAGEFWEKENDYRELIQELGIKGAVFIDNRYIPNEVIPIYFKAADLFVAPYIGGTQSGAIKIAIAFNLPMIIGKVIDTDPWMESEKEACSIIDPQNIQTFAQVIEDRYRSSKKRDKIEINLQTKSKWSDLVSLIENLNLETLRE